MKSNISQQFPNIVQLFVGGVPDHAIRGLRDCYKKSGPQILFSAPAVGPGPAGPFCRCALFPSWEAQHQSRSEQNLQLLKITKSSLHQSTQIYTMVLHQIIMQTQWPTNLGQLGHVGFSPATWGGAPSDSGPGHRSRRTFCWCTREMAWPEVSTAIPENWEQFGTLKRQRTMTNERTMTKRSKMQKVNKCISKINIYAWILWFIGFIWNTWGFSDPRSQFLLELLPRRGVAQIGLPGWHRTRREKENKNVAGAFSWARNVLQRWWVVSTHTDPYSLQLIGLLHVGVIMIHVS